MPHRSHAFGAIRLGSALALVCVLSGLAVLTHDAAAFQVAPADAESATVVRPLVSLPLPVAPAGAPPSFVVERVAYPVGAALTVREQREVRVIGVEQGALDVRVAGAAVRIPGRPAAALLDPGLDRVQGAVMLLAGDALAIPVHTAFTLRNPGETASIALEVSLRSPRPLTPMTDRGSTWAGAVQRERLWAAIAAAPGTSVSLTIARVILAPGGRSEPIVGTGLVIVESGILGATVDVAAGAPAATELAPLPSGTHASLVNLGATPLAVLVLRDVEAGGARAG